MKIPKIHYVPSSHWDREWYLPFQVYRHKLVRLMDGLLDDLSRGHYLGPFTGDGQAILIADYLKIRPERTEQLRQLVAEGKIIFGPWYVLPDEFLVSGESLIRNIRYGKEVVREFGGTPSNVGMVSDLFGHNSQMPQILAGFGMPGALIWRGVDVHVGARFDWVGADGTIMPTYRFGKSGYCDYTYKVRRSPEHETQFDPEQARIDLQNFINEELERTGGSVGLVFDGGDHLFIDPDHYEIIREFAADDSTEFRLIHSTLDDFISELLSSETAAPPRIEGELREPGRWPTSEDHQFLIPGVGSSRVWIKQENSSCETLLCHWLEPFAALAHRLLGIEHPDSYLRLAWEWLLKNHPHDSICGCSIDQVHEDMKFRFSQTKQIAQVCLDEALSCLAAAAPGDLRSDELRISLFNPHPRSLEKVVEFEVEVPTCWPESTEFFGFENKPVFRLFDQASGREIPWQRLGTQRNQVRKITDEFKYPKAYEVHLVKVAAELTLPAFGQTLIKVCAQSRGSQEADHLGNLDIAPVRFPVSPGLRTGLARMENEHLIVEIQSNGGITLKDKANGRRFNHLNLFESDADIGDGWYHGPVVNRLDSNSYAGHADIELLVDTPLLTRFLVRQTLNLPQQFDAEHHARSAQKLTQEIESTLTLRKGAQELEVETSLTNRVGDHRLRVLFPTDIQADTFFSDSAFDVVERPISLRTDNHLYREMEVEPKPQQSWTAVHDQQAGLAIVCAGGLLEAAVIDRPDRAIALTLLRATGRTVMTNGEAGGQLFKQPLHFRYRIVPLSNPTDLKVLFDHAQELATGWQQITHSSKTLARTRSRYQLTNNPLPTSDAPLSIEGDAVLTSCRQLGTGLEIRLFNPTQHPIEVKIHLHPALELSNAQAVDLDSAPLPSPPIALSHGILVFPMNAKKIITWRIS